MDPRLGGTPTTAPREPEFAVLLRRLHEIHSRLCELRNIAEATADRVVGPIPQPAASELSAGRPAEQILIYTQQMSALLALMNVDLERTYSAVTRITNEF